MFNFLKNQLGNSIPNGDWKVFVRGVRQGNHDLASVTGIDGSWGIQHCDAVLGCQATARVNKPHVTIWHGNSDSSLHKGALAGS
jgi:hypothetical protein